MKRNLILTLLVLFLFSNPAFSQLQLKMSTDKSEYGYGEKITIFAAVKNISDTTYSIMMSSYQSCQAEFKLNNYDTGSWTSCLTTSELLTFLPNQERIYEWEIDPYIFGMPNKDGIQKLVGTFSGGMTNTISLIDSLEFIAPFFLGGQLIISYNDSNYAVISSLRDSLNVVVTDSIHYSSLQKTNETWQITGTSIDSIYDKYSNDNRFASLEYNREIKYKNIITAVSQDNFPNKFSVDQNYPNPFNPSTEISYQLSDLSNVVLKVYDILGREVRTLVNENQSPGYYRIKFDATGLSSGVYIYRIKAGRFVNSKKMILLK